MEINEISEKWLRLWIRNLELLSDSLNWAMHKCEGMRKGRKLHLWRIDVSFNLQPTKGIHSVPTVKVKGIRKLMRAVFSAFEMYLNSSQSAEVLSFTCQICQSKHLMSSAWFICSSGVDVHRTVAGKPNQRQEMQFLFISHRQKYHSPYIHVSLWQMFLVASVVLSTYYKSFPM